MTDEASGVREVNPWPAILREFRVAAINRLGGEVGEYNYPEVAEILDAANPTSEGLQSATDRVRALKAPDDVGDDVIHEYADLVASVAGDWQQLLDGALSEPSSMQLPAPLPAGGGKGDVSGEITLRYEPKQGKSRPIRQSAPADFVPRGSEPNHPAYAVALVVGPVTVIVAQMFGVFGWLFLGYAVYLAGVGLLIWVLRRAPITEEWKSALEYGLPLLGVALVAVIFRNAIHPVFAWSNAFLFFSH